MDELLESLADLVQSVVDSFDATAFYSAVGGGLAAGLIAVLAGAWSSRRINRGAHRLESVLDLIPKIRSEYGKKREQHIRDLQLQTLMIGNRRETRMANSVMGSSRAILEADASQRKSSESGQTPLPPESVVLASRSNSMTA